MRASIRTAAAVLLLWAGACGRPSTEDVDAGAVDAGVVDAGVECPTLWPVGATSVRLTRREGYGYRQTCAVDGGEVIDRNYELELPDGRLSWTVCLFGPRFYAGRTVLTQVQREQFETAMGELRCAPRDRYGADFPDLYIDLAVDGGTLRYLAYGNPPKPEEVYVLLPGVNRVQDVFDDIAGIP